MESNNEEKNQKEQKSCEFQYTLKDKPILNYQRYLNPITKNTTLTFIYVLGVWCISVFSAFVATDPAHWAQLLEVVGDTGFYLMVAILLLNF